MSAGDAVLHAMRALYPGDAAAVAAANVAALVAAVVLAAWFVSYFFARSSGAAARHGVWLCALACVIAGSAVTAAFPQSRAALVRLPLQGAGGAEPALAAPGVTPAASAAAPAPNVPERVAGTAADSASEARRADARAAAAPARRGPGRVYLLRAAGGALAGVWLLGVVLLAVRLGLGWWSLCALRREAGPPEDPLSRHSIDQARRALGLKRGQPLPPVLESGRVSSPVTFGLLKPVVVLPAGLPSRLEPAQLRDVLVHEFAHVLRRDPVTGLVQRMVAAVLWPHPLVHLLNRELNRAREELCDDYVLSGHAAGTTRPNGDDGARSYARALVALAELRGRSSLRPLTRRYAFNPFRPAPPAVGILDARWPLESRVAGLLDQRRKVMTRLNRPVRLLLAVTFVLAATAAGGVRFLGAAPERPERPDRPAGPATKPAAPAAGAGKAAAPTAAELLERPVKQVQFPGIAFADAIQFLRDVSGLNIVTDWRALEEAGIDRNVPVEYIAKDVKMRAALKAVTTLAGDSKNPVAYGLIGDVVFVSTAAEVAAAVKAAEALPAKAQDAAAKELMAQSLVELNFDQVALQDAVQLLKDLSGGTIVVHWRELEAAGVDRNVPVKLRVFNTRFDQALYLVLRVATGGKADFTVEERQVMIRSAEAAAGPAGAAGKGPATAPARPPK